MQRSLIQRSDKFQDFADLAKIYHIFSRHSDTAVWGT
jgi:hypothetical protein